MKSNLLKNRLNLRGLMLFGAAAAFFLSVAAGCKSDIDDATPQEAAAFNVYNASPGPLAVNFYLDNLLVNGPALAFTQQSDYILAYTGQRKFDITVGGTNQVLATQTLSFTNNHYYTAFIAGSNSAPVVVVTDDDLAAPASGKAKIRLVQMIPDATSVDLNVSGGATLFADQAFKSASAFAAIDPGTYNFTVQASDAASAALNNITIQAGKSYTVVARGMIAGNGDFGVGGSVYSR
ncbi:DUF4397 domain-containing protein [Hufsiella ginkgonis]|uniref:DUF4397 domain-containing protein n=1 Tax=Hufsiella ginkgonis TaxID=2695274 RepID=A0A7K1XYP1_9SPHI|nr:DUF4397 domain-containing protein [Hufsiella ginkgonis]MXV16090.1 DUF4397 domain-containing protein [Hufsiella ginkgonis]